MQEMPPRVTLQSLVILNVREKNQAVQLQTLLSDRQRWPLTRGLKYSDLTKITEIFGIMDIHM